MLTAPPCAHLSSPICGGQRWAPFPWGAAQLPAAPHAAILRYFLLLFFCFRLIVCLLALMYLFIPPPSLANFSTRIAFIHESPPFLSLTRARSHCRREEARTLFPLFKVTRLVPGTGAPAHPPCLVFHVCSPQPPPSRKALLPPLPTWNLMERSTPTLSARVGGLCAGTTTLGRGFSPPPAQPTACRVWAFLAGMGGEVSAGRSAGSVGVMRGARCLRWEPAVQVWMA